MFLYFLWENEETKHISLKKKKIYLVKEFPELCEVPIKTLWSFYTKKVGLSYKRIGRRRHKNLWNYGAITEFLVFLKKKLDGNYVVLSLDETSFGINDLRKYGWSEKGKMATKQFES